jgi:hypothetical protein
MATISTLRLKRWWLGTFPALLVAIGGLGLGSAVHAQVSAQRTLSAHAAPQSSALVLAPHAWSATPAGPLANVFNAGEVVPLRNGNVLISDMGKLDRSGGMVLIANRAGQRVWYYHGSLDIPHSAYPMPNGDVLIADTGDNRVIEVNRKSQIVWDSDNLGGGKGRLGQGRLSDGSTLAYPNDAKPLPNGQILISLRLQSRVVQITRTGRITWQTRGILDRQHNPQRLANGDTLIADSDANRIVEVDPTGTKVVWNYHAGLSWPRDADLLANGNVLIADSNHSRLIEVTRSGHLVRQWTGIPHVYSAAPLANGNILVGDGSTYGVVEINRQHRIVWVLNHPTRRSGTEVTMMPQIVNGGFEQVTGPSSSAPYGWDRNDALAYSLAPGQRADMTRDASIRHSGRYSGRISYHGDSNGLDFSQTVRLVAGHRYRFSAWIKTKNVTVCHPCSYGQSPPGRTAEYELSFYSNTGTAPPAPALPTHTGTSGWVHDKVQFVAPAGVTSLGINATLRGQGTVWFDDVSLTDLGS